MNYDTQETAEAVILFSESKISREMLYAEFEAILDGVVPVLDFKSQAAKAVYLIINTRFQIESAVFFLLDFDDKGMVDRRWNIPLQQLAEVSGRGPDLGAGPIRLSCYSQCAIAWHQKKLWDPVLDSPSSSFELLKQSVKANRMGIFFKKSVDTTTASPILAPINESANLAIQQQIHEHYNKSLREQISEVLKEQRLRIATLHSKQQETIHALQQDHQQRLESYQAKIKMLEENNADLEAKLAAMKDSFDVQAAKVQGMREYFSHKLKAAQNDENEQIQAIQDNFAVELELRLQTATAELREMLDMREVELFYRHQNELALKEEIVKHKQAYDELLNNGGDQLLLRLNKAGVNFVAYHPGIGQLTIPLEDLSRYLDNAPGYVAKVAGIGEQLYSKWFEHYQHPICNAKTNEGHLCGKALIRIGSPIEFHVGESDRCEHHQEISYKLNIQKR